MAVRAVLVVIGLPAVAFSMVSDGGFRTGWMFKFWADAEAKLPAWHTTPWWTYLYIPIMGLLSWYGYYNWHPLVAIYFIFTTFSASLICTSKIRWLKFWWFAVRNPTHGFAAMFKQPIKEPRPNPDDLVYTQAKKSAHRWLRHGIFSEYWYLRSVGKKKFEFRIGWKFADGTPGFTPTSSIRVGD